VPLKFPTKASILEPFESLVISAISRDFPDTSRPGILAFDDLFLSGPERSLVVTKSTQNRASENGAFFSYSNLIVFATMILRLHQTLYFQFEI
jgi:hypothetical protein